MTCCQAFSNCLCGHFKPRCLWNTTLLFFPRWMQSIEVSCTRAAKLVQINEHSINAQFCQLHINIKLVFCVKLRTASSGEMNKTRRVDKMTSVTIVLLLQNFRNVSVPRDFEKQNKSCGMLKLILIKAASFLCSSITNCFERKTWNIAGCGIGVFRRFAW